MKTLKVVNNKLYSSLTVLFLANILTLYTISNLKLLNIFIWVIYLFPLMGLLLYKTLKLDKHYSNPAIKAPFIYGLLICVLFGIGLITNTIGLITDKPLLTSSLPLLLFDILLLFLIYNNRNLLDVPYQISNQLKQLPKGTKFLPVLFPVFAILGTIQLNNNGGNSFALFTLIVIMLYQIYISFIRPSKDESFYAINIFFTSLALALSYSLRSNYVIGYDINQELSVFMHTFNNGVWNPQSIESAYNACISITILPTVIANYINIDPQYIYKLIMQITLSFIPLIVFSIAKIQSAKNNIAYISSIYFIAQIQFISQFPALIRQQLAVMFFALLIFVILDKSLKRKTRSLLMLVFGIGMILSHYSTAYIGIALLIITILFAKLYNIVTNRKSKTRNIEKVYVHIIPTAVILSLVIMSFLWYALISQNTGGLIQKFSKSISEISNITKASSRSEDVANIFSFNKSYDSQEDIEEIRNIKPVSSSYYGQEFSKYPIEIRSTTSLTVGGISGVTVYKIFNKFIPALMKIIAVIGILYTIILALKRLFPIESGLLIISGTILLISFVVLPTISQEYNIERLYQQFLIFMSVVFFYGIRFILFFMKKRAQYIIASVLVIAYFSSSTFLINNIAFGFSEVSLSNSGSHYSRHYLNKNERFSMIWLENNQIINSQIQSDKYGKLRLEAYTKNMNNITEASYPSQYSKNSYVLATYSNTRKKLVFATYKNKVLVLNFQEEFLTNNKNGVYSNSKSAIYR